jgi:3-phenylpropionate/cinnamic acid dioxygenase small subunit
MAALTGDDRLAIQDVLHRYCHHLDRGQWDELAALFTEDCRLDLSQMLGCYDGHAGLRQFGELIGSVKLFMRHLVTNIVIDGDGEQARARAYVIAITGPQGSAPRQSTGLYEDELVKRGGRWLLHRRHLTLDVPG